MSDQPILHRRKSTQDTTAKVNPLAPKPKKKKAKNNEPLQKRPEMALYVISYWNSKDILPKVNEFAGSGEPLRGFSKTIRSIKKLKNGKLIPGHLSTYGESDFETAIDNYCESLTNPLVFPEIKRKPTSLDKFMYAAQLPMDSEEKKSLFLKYQQPPVFIASFKEASLQREADGERPRHNRSVSAPPVAVQEPQTAVIQARNEETLHLIMDAYSRRVQNKADTYNSSRALVSSERVAKRSKDYEHFCFASDALEDYIDANARYTSRLDGDLHLWVNDIFECLESLHSKIFPAKLGELFSFWEAGEGFDKWCRGSSGPVGKHTPKTKLRIAEANSGRIDPIADIFNHYTPSVEQEERHVILELRQMIEHSQLWESTAVKEAQGVIDAHYNAFFNSRGPDHCRYFHLTPDTPAWVGRCQWIPEEMVRFLAHSTNPYPDYHPEGQSIRVLGPLQQDLVQARTDTLRDKYPKDEFPVPVFLLREVKTQFLGHTLKFVFLKQPVDFMHPKDVLKLRFDERFGPAADKYCMLMREYEPFCPEDKREQFEQLIRRDHFLKKSWNFTDESVTIGNQ